MRSTTVEKISIHTSLMRLNEEHQLEFGGYTELRLDDTNDSFLLTQKQYL